MARARVARANAMTDGFNLELSDTIRFFDNEPAMNQYATAIRTTTPKDLHPKAITLAVLVALTMPGAAMAQVPSGQVVGSRPADVAGVTAGASLQYTGGLSQVGIGIDRDARLHGQASHVLSEDPLSAWIAQAWLGNRAGGLRLDYNWIPGIDGKADGAAFVRKLFAAVDQNRDDDRKLTLGAGLEDERWFGSVSASRGLTGKRYLGGPLVEQDVATVGGSDNGRPYLDTITTTTTTRYFRQAYDYGFGVRAGTFLPEAQMRVSLGLDREWGDYSSRQNTVSLGIEKFFSGSPHSIALFLENYDKAGKYENRGNGTRALLAYRYSFGGSTRASSAGWREARLVHRVEVPGSGSETREVVDAVQSAPPVVQTRKEMRIVKTTASMASDAFFEFDKAELTAIARRELDRVADILKTTERAGNIRIAGHTCDIGTEAYNLRLSQRRANAVRGYLAKAGLPADAFVAEGLGESKPKYPNTRATREKNRRVDVEFVQYRDKQEEVQVPIEVVTPVPLSKRQTVAPVTWREEVIDQEPAWVRRALRNTVPHKQTVDSYRGAKVTQVASTSRTWVNRAPVAQDDAVTVAQNATATIDVLGNDSDPDGNALAIVSVGAAAHGTVSIAGNALRYTPAAGYVGSDVFTYAVDDGAGGQASAMVRVTVQRANQPPLAHDDSFTVGYSGDWPLNVLANDADPDGDALSFISFTQPSQAVGTVAQDGNRLVFRGAARFMSVTFTYTISDGHGGTSTATVTLIDP